MIELSINLYILHLKFTDFCGGDELPSSRSSSIGPTHIPSSRSSSIGPTHTSGTRSGGGIPRLKRSTSGDFDNEISKNKDFYRSHDVRPPFTYAALIRQVKSK